MGSENKSSQRALAFRKREVRILDQAEALFLAHGEENVTVEMIADAVNIGKGTIYKHFASKDEIVISLMIRYEEDLARVFQQLEQSSSEDQAKLAKEYFSFRMREPEKYALFDRLERQLANKTIGAKLLAPLYEIRSSNLDNLAKSIKLKIEDGILSDVPPYFHILAAWALVHGAVALQHSKYYQELIEDSDAFFSFIGDIGIRMGNRKER